MRLRAALVGAAVVALSATSSSAVVRITDDVGELHGLFRSPIRPFPHRAFCYSTKIRLRWYKDPILLMESKGLLEPLSDRTTLRALRVFGPASVRSSQKAYSKGRKNMHVLTSADF